MTRSIARCVAALALVAPLAGGCKVMPLEAWDKHVRELEGLREKSRVLAEENQKLRTQLAGQEKQIRTLQSLGPKRLEKLYYVERIRLGRYTGAVDLDDKPGDDAVKVLLEPIDQHADAIKAPGEALVQLYDLAEPPGKNLLGEYRWNVEQLAKTWAGGFLSYHYGLECPWKSTPPQHEEVTVRVEFTEYLTGRTFTAQKVCKVNLPRAPATRPAKPVAP
jgi:hypothetical protein